MGRVSRFWRACGLTLAAAAFTTVARAQTNPTYIQFSPAPVKGALYRPDSGPAPHVGIVIVHRTANFLGAPAARELSRRGFMVLAMNPRSDPANGYVDGAARYSDRSRRGTSRRRRSA